MGGSVPGQRPAFGPSTFIERVAGRLKNQGIYVASEQKYPASIGLVSGFCSSGPSFASGFLQTLPRDNALAFS
jgi:hypothetical protein